MKTGQFSVLAHLSREPGLDQSTLAARIGVEPARVSQLVEELEAMGLIERSINSHDRRAAFFAADATRSGALRLGLRLR